MFESKYSYNLQQYCCCTVCLILPYTHLHTGISSSIILIWHFCQQFADFQGTLTHAFILQRRINHMADVVWGLLRGLNDLTDCTTMKNTLTCRRYRSSVESEVFV